METILHSLLNIPEFIVHAWIESVNLLPFLFIIFVFIELFEHYFSKKIKVFLKYSKKIGPVFGAILAIIPQCGFSVIATLFYLRKFVSLGTLLAVYIATSDEAIPVLFAEPNAFKTIVDLIIVKLILAITVGYLTDFFVKNSFNDNDTNSDEKIQVLQGECGCCNHSISEKKVNSLLLHPFKHTLIIFSFIFVVCVGLNYVFEVFPEDVIEKCMLQNSFLQPIFVGIFGLIPNCSVSVLIAMMYLKGVLSFGSVIAGLSSGAGLGLLALIRKNKDCKNTLLIIFILLTSSIIAGIILQSCNIFISGKY